ncbi:cupin domain-containing protein [Candidatus Poribacteria bacterium]|nr:cupin domain-containing protein [Candidatus Poribacteria bacterium]
MKRLISDDLYSWSIFSEMRQIDFNGYLWIRSEGNVLIDPVPMIDSDLAQLDELGGAAWMVITNRDHEREAEAFRKRTGAKVVVHEADADGLSGKADRLITDGEEIVPGLRAIQLRYGKSPGEIALYFLEKGMVLFGDLIVGEPIGALTLLADEKLGNPPKAALELRKILALPFNAILVGDGHSILHEARQRLIECLQRRTDIYINRINIDEIDWMQRNAPPPYDFEDKDIDPLIGARHLGYRLIRLQPKVASFPMHLHHFGEEMFYVINGGCTLKTPRGNLAVTKGDFIAFPPGESGAHKFVNEGDTACTLLAVGTVLSHDVSEYPDSNKVYPYVTKRIFRKDGNVSYWEGEA